MDEGTINILLLTAIAFLDLEAVQVVLGWSVLSSGGSVISSGQSTSCSECLTVGSGSSNKGVIYSYLYIACLWASSYPLQKF